MDVEHFKLIWYNQTKIVVIKLRVNSGPSRYLIAFWKQRPKKPERNGWSASRLRWGPDTSPQTLLETAANAWKWSQWCMTYSNTCTFTPPYPSSPWHQCSLLQHLQAISHQTPDLHDRVVRRLWVRKLYIVCQHVHKRYNNANQRNSNVSYMKIKTKVRLEEQKLKNKYKK